MANEIKREISVVDLKKTDLAALPPRPADAHKGTFGRVLVIGGSLGMGGAGFFAAKGALRAGAGLCEIFTIPENRVIYQTALPEALVSVDTPENGTTALRAALKRATAVAVGMGMGQTPRAAALLAETLAAAQCPLVVDADALNLIAADDILFAALRERAYRAPTVLTPHLGEMARLTGNAINEIAADPARFAHDFAKETATITVLKSHKTVISDGRSVYRNTFGNSGMATGGSGDVLAGVIAAFLAQGADGIDAARLGVLAHALAGDAAIERRGNHGMLASDIVDGLCAVLP